MRIPLWLRRGSSWASAHPDLLAVTLVLGVALLPRLAIMFRAPALYVVGSRPYYATAIQMVNGLELSALSLRHTPGYPFFLTGVIALFGIEPLAIAFVQHLLGAASAVLCYFIGKIVANRLVGLAAGLLTGVNTTLVAYEHHILTEPLYVFLMLSSILLLVVAARRKPGWLFVLAGCVIGVATLTRPIGQTMMLAAPVALLLCYRHWRPTAFATALLVAGFALGAGPWMLRNSLTHREAGVRHPGSTLMGTVMHERFYTKGFFTLDGGTDPDPQRMAARRIIERMSPDEPDPLEMWTAIQEQVKVSPAVANRLMGEIAFDTISRHPWHYARVFAEKIWNLFQLPRDEVFTTYLERTREQWPGRLLTPSIRDGYLPNLRISEPALAQQWELKRAAEVGDFFRPTRWAHVLAALFTIGVAGAILNPSRRFVLVPALVILGIMVVNGIVAGDKPRYRYPLDPAIMTIAAAGVLFLTEFAGSGARLLMARLRDHQLPAAAS
jgi:hypothetical protein